MTTQKKITQTPGNKCSGYLGSDPLFPKEEAFKEAFKETEAQIGHLPSWRGKISQSPSDLLAYLQEKDALALNLDRLYSYAFQSSDQDTGNTKTQALKNQALGLYTRFCRCHRLGIAGAADSDGRNLNRLVFQRKGP